MFEFFAVNDDEEIWEVRFIFQIQDSGTKKKWKLSLEIKGSEHISVFYMLRIDISFTFAFWNNLVTKPITFII